MIFLYLRKGGKLRMEQDDLAKQVGRNLKKLFAKYGKTYEDVAKILNADPRTIGRWVQNGLDKLSTIEWIAEKFGIEAKDIIYPKD